MAEIGNVAVLPGPEIISKVNGPIPLSAALTEIVPSFAPKQVTWLKLSTEMIGYTAAGTTMSINLLQFGMAVLVS